MIQHGDFWLLWIARLQHSDRIGDCSRQNLVLKARNTVKLPGPDFPPHNTYASGYEQLTGLRKGAVDLQAGRVLERVRLPSSD
jgi:hypothetical protein